MHLRKKIEHKNSVNTQVNYDEIKRFMHDLISNKVHERKENMHNLITYKIKDKLENNNIVHKEDNFSEWF